jgi:hypothetical protein
LFASKNSDTAVSTEDVIRCVLRLRGFKISRFKFQGIVPRCTPRPEHLFSRFVVLKTRTGVQSSLAVPIVTSVSQ